MKKIDKNAPSPYYYIHAEFPFSDNYANTTRNIEKFVGAKCSGSGTDFRVRDISFVSYSAKKSVDIFLKLCKYASPKLSNVTITREREFVF